MFYFENPFLCLGLLSREECLAAALPKKADWSSGSRLHTPEKPGFKHTGIGGTKAEKGRFFGA